MKANTSDHADHYQKNKEYQRRYREKNREKRAEAAKAYREKNAEQIKAKRAEYRLKNGPKIRIINNCNYKNKPELWILSNIKRRCKDRGIPFNLTIEDIAAPEICPVLGFPLRRNRKEGGGPLDDSPAVDRIKPELGYVKGNVIVVSHLANRIKSNATPEQIRKVAAFYEKLISKKGDGCGD